MLVPENFRVPETALSLAILCLRLVVVLPLLVCWTGSAALTSTSSHRSTQKAFPRTEEALRRITYGNIIGNGFTIATDEIGYRNGVKSHECKFKNAGQQYGYVVRFIKSDFEFVVLWRTFGPLLSGKARWSQSQVQRRAGKQAMSACLSRGEQ
jgi:hypothetical protein